MKRLWGILLLLLLLTGGEIVAGTPTKLIYSQSSESITLHPHNVNDVYSRRIVANVFDRLIETNENLEIVPGLAESWEQIDPLTLKFNLRKGVKFQNGDELTSEDVKYTFENAKKSPIVGTLYEMIDTVETPDEYTALFKTLVPSGALLPHLTHISSSIINKKYYESTEDTNLNPMGTGAYTLEEWKSGSYITLKRFDDYFRGQAPIETIEVRVVPEENSRVIAVETGEHHIAGNIDSIGRTVLADRDDVTIEEISSLGVAYLGLNMSKEPLNDIRVRKAIVMAIDRDIIIDSVLDGAVTKANSLLGPGVVGYSKDTLPYEYNLEEAKKLLAEAGHENLKFTLSTSNNDLRRQMAEIIQAQLKEIGIEIKIEILEWATFLNATGNGSTDLFMMGWSNSSGDADFALTALLHSSMKGEPGNRSFFENKEFDKLVDAGKLELDKEKRDEIYAKAQEIMNREIPVLPLYFQPASAAVRTEVKGFVQSPINMPTFYKLSF